MIGLLIILPLMSVYVQTVTELLKKIPLLNVVIGLLSLLIYQALDASVNNLLESLFRSSTGTPNWVWFVAAFSVLLNIIFPVGISFWLLSSVKANQSWRSDFQQLLIETLRVWGKILLYTLFLVIPGLWKWLSSIFVPYVVLYSKTYQQGDADAIQASHFIFKKVWGWSILIVIVFSIAIPFGLTSAFDEYREIWIHPLPAFLLGLTEYICLLISLFLLLKLFMKASHEVQNELIF